MRSLIITRITRQQPSEAGVDSLGSNSDLTHKRSPVTAVAPVYYNDVRTVIVQQDGAVASTACRLMYRDCDDNPACPRSVSGAMSDT
jgi:hypothetical protein